MTFIPGQKFPTDTLKVVMPDGSFDENFSLKDYAGGGYTVVFFYPKDFTFVCPTEIVTFDKLMPKFEALNTKVVAASVDTLQSHADWRNTPLNKGGIDKVKFPMIADDDKKLSKELGILDAEELTYRASYLIDREGIIRHVVVNDMPLGRNIEDMLRMIDALQFTEEHGEVCPANWSKGKRAMSATTESTAEYLADSF